MSCGECGASYAKSGKSRLGCQGASKKGPSYCGNRLTIRQDELDARVLGGLQTEMLRKDVLAVFLQEYDAEMCRLATSKQSALPEREVELAQVDAQLADIEAAIIKGIDAAMFVDEMKQLSERRGQLAAQVAAGLETTNEVASLLNSDLSCIYRKKVARLTDAFEDEALRAQAFERIRALIETVVLTPEYGALSVQLRGELASMLELCASPETRSAPEAVASGALQIKMVAGTRNTRCLRSQVTPFHRLVERRVPRLAA